MAALIEPLALIALVITIIAGLIQISDWLAKKNKRSDKE